VATEMLGLTVLYKGWLYSSRSPLMCSCVSFASADVRWNAKAANGKLNTARDANPASTPFHVDINFHC